MKWRQWGITGGVVLLALMQVGVWQWQIRPLVGLTDEVRQLREDVGRLKDWQVATAEVGEAEPKPAIQADTAKIETANKTVVSVRQSDGAASREVYITLGSGSTASQDWTDTAAQAYIDTGQYKIKAAYFEASLRANSGQVWARLINKNENNYVAGSEITHNTPTSTLIRSGKINLPVGNKLYGVQLKSETQQQVNVENAKVRLIVE